MVLKGMTSKLLSDSFSRWLEYLSDMSGSHQRCLEEKKKEKKNPRFLFGQRKGRKQERRGKKGGTYFKDFFFSPLERNHTTGSFQFCYFLSAVHGSCLIHSFSLFLGANSVCFPSGLGLLPGAEGFPGGHSQADRPYLLPTEVLLVPRQSLWLCWQGITLAGMYKEEYSFQCPCKKLCRHLKRPE